MAHLRKVISIDEARQRRAAKAEQPVTKPEIAEHFKVHPRTIERWMSHGLPYHKPYEGGSVRFYVSECDEWFRSIGRAGTGS